MTPLAAMLAVMLTAAPAPPLILWEGPMPSHCEPIRSRFLHRHLSVKGRSGDAGDVAGTLEAAVAAMQEAAAKLGADTVRVTWSEARRVAGRESIEYRLKGKAYQCGNEAAKEAHQ